MERLLGAATTASKMTGFNSESLTDFVSESWGNGEV
jgi:hypothetical protein